MTTNTTTAPYDVPSRPDWEARVRDDLCDWNYLYTVWNEKKDAQAVANMAAERWPGVPWSVVPTVDSRGESTGRFMVFSPIELAR